MDAPSRQCGQGGRRGADAAAWRPCRGARRRSCGDRRETCAADRLRRPANMRSVIRTIAAVVPGRSSGTAMLTSHPPRERGSPRARPRPARGDGSVTRSDAERSRRADEVGDRRAITTRNGVSASRYSTVRSSELPLSCPPYPFVHGLRHRQRSDVKAVGMTREKDYASSGCRSGRQLEQGRRPAASARSREPNSVTSAIGIVPMSPQLGTQYSSPA